MSNFNINLNFTTWQAGKPWQLNYIVQQQKYFEMSSSTCLVSDPDDLYYNSW